MKEKQLCKIHLSNGTTTFILVDKSMSATDKLQFFDNTIGSFISCKFMDKVSFFTKIKLHFHNKRIIEKIEQFKRFGFETEKLEHQLI